MDQSLRRKLDRITDILWAGGVTNPVTYIEQISYLIYLKLLDEEEAARELKSRLVAGGGARLFPRQAERYRWSKWRFRSGNAAAFKYSVGGGMRSVAAGRAAIMRRRGGCGLAGC